MRDILLVYFAKSKNDKFNKQTLWNLSYQQTYNFAEIKPTIRSTSTEIGITSKSLRDSTIPEIL